YENVPVAYSPGNFVFWTRRKPIFNNIGYLVHLDFYGHTLGGCSVSPYKLTPAGLTTINGKQRKWFFAQMNQATEPLADDQSICDVWAAFSDRLGWQNSIESIKRLISGIEDEATRPLSAAKFKNLFLTPAHANMYYQTLDRLQYGESGSAPSWAKKLVDKWLDTTDWQVMEK